MRGLSILILFRNNKKKKKKKKVIKIIQFFIQYLNI